MNKLGRFLSMLGLILTLVSTSRPTRSQGPEEGWQVYTNGNYVEGLVLAGGGVLGGGYTWVATGGGVVCYGASQQVKFTTLDGLADNDVQAVAEDGEGRWWFGTGGGGVSVLDDSDTPFDKADDSWATFTTADGLAGKYVYAIAADDGGRWWFGHNGNGVSVLDHGGTPFYKGDDTWITFTTADGLADKDVWAIAAAGRGQWWFGTWCSGASFLDDGGTPFDKGDDIWTTFTTAHGLASNCVEAIAEDSGGRLWFGTDRGVSVLDDGDTPFDKEDDTWNTFTTTTGLADNDVKAVIVDIRGPLLWFGTYGGVSVLDHKGTPFYKGDDTWTSFTTADGLAGEWIEAITQDSEGRLWFGSDGDGVSVLYDKGTPFNKGDDTWTAFATADSLVHNHAWAVAEANGGRLWFGTNCGGASVLDDGGTFFYKGDDTWATFTESDGLTADCVNDIALDSGERLWFSTPCVGMSMLDDGGTPFDKGNDKWTTFTTDDGLAGDCVESIVGDGAVRLWFGTNDGVSVLDHGGTPFDKRDDTWTTFTTTHGLAHDYVSTIAEDDRGRWWFGTFGGGVSVLDDGGTPFEKGDDAWTTFTTADGLAGNYIFAIAEDGVGGRWFGTGFNLGAYIYGNGVSVLDDGGTPFDKADDRWTTFTRSDGLADYLVNVIVRDSRGRLWFGTNGGVSVIDHNGTPRYKGDDTWTTFTTADGLGSNYIRAIAEDSRGQWWFGTGGGVSVLVDRVAPTSSASSPISVTDGTIPVSWSASDGGSGILGASLWVKYGEDGVWTETGLYQPVGTFYYTPAQGHGTYYFATVAEDWMGNVETMPAGPGDTSTDYGTERGDAYEPDDVCDQAKPLASDGSIQRHTFHQRADADWARFAVVSATTYVVQATSTSGGADLVLELYDRCGGNLEASDDNAFGSDARIIFAAPTGGPYYVKALNHAPAIYGPGVTYELSVRAQSPAPIVVIVAGRNEADQLEDNITYMGDQAYGTFRRAGVPPENIRYLSVGVDRDVDQDGHLDVDGAPTWENARYAVRDWPQQRGLQPGKPFYLYLVDHGGTDYYCAAGCGDGKQVSAADLDGWLSDLEAATGADEVNVIIEACYSGSFIDVTTYGPAEISSPGRVVITSTGSRVRAFPSEHGGYFSDAFFTALGNNADLWTSYVTGRTATQAAWSEQTPWLDDNGDAVGDGGDGLVARGRGLIAEGGGAIPVVDWLRAGEVRESGTATITAQVRDDRAVLTVTVEVYPPGLAVPETGEGEMPVLPVERVVLTNKDGHELYGATYAGFTETGIYRLVGYAWDDDGNLSLPREAIVGERKVYLPLVTKQ